MLSLVRTDGPQRILDLGCGRDGRSLADHVPDTWDITGLDLHDPDEVHVAHPRFTYLQRDAQDLRAFEDDAFDIAFSIGMLEHVCLPAALHLMAQEIDRVARQYVVVVPWRWAWLEPHFKFPFFQLLPRRAQNRLVRALDLDGRAGYVAADPDYVPKRYQWLASAAWRRIFPGATVHVAPTWETIAIVKRAPRGTLRARGPA